MKTSYIFLQPTNCGECYTTFDENKNVIDTFFPQGTRKYVIEELAKIDAVLITDEAQAVSMGLDIYED